MKRIHIVGVSPRTGTTLMAEALKTCFTIDTFTSHEDRLFARAATNGRIFLTKAPKDIMIVAPSLRVDSDLYVICMIRDPRDIICSKHKKNPERYWAGLKYWKTYTQALEQIANHPRFISIKYEEFVSEPDNVQKTIAQKIPFLKTEVPFSKYHEVAEVTEASKQALRSVRPIKPTSVGRWKEHRARIKGQLEIHGSITDDLISYGYEKSSDWLQELDGVEADLTPSHNAEYMTFTDRRWLTLGKYCEASRRIIEQQIGRRIRITHPKKWF